MVSTIGGGGRSLHASHGSLLRADETVGGSKPAVPDAANVLQERSGLHGGAGAVRAAARSSKRILLLLGRHSINGERLGGRAPVQPKRSGESKKWRMDQCLSLLGSSTSVPGDLEASRLYVQSAVPPVLRGHGEECCAGEDQPALWRAAF